MNQVDGSIGEVRAAQKGDHGALRALWQRHRRWVAAVLLAHKPRGVELEDLLQEVATTMVSRLGELRDPEAFKPWLRMVAVNAARAQGRKTTRRRERSAEGLEERAASVPPLAERDEAARVLRLALQLPDAYREPLLLRCVHGMSHREIGRVLDLPETTIETRIARGRRMLREMASGESSTPVRPATGASEGAP